MIFNVLIDTNKQITLYAHIYYSYTITYTTLHILTHHILYYIYTVHYTIQARPSGSPKAPTKAC